MEKNPIVVAGGYIRSCITGEPVSDIDCFHLSSYENVIDLAKASQQLAAKHAMELSHSFQTNKRMVETDNAVTVYMDPPVQFIHRWRYEKPEDVVESFDFTICAAAFWYSQGLNGWCSSCVPEFYEDLAAKRLVYRNPKRDEAAGGSILRVLKYYRRGYNITLPSFADVIARVVEKVDTDRAEKVGAGIPQVVLGLLREVDPMIDIHISDAAVPLGVE
jgi:hypothetical protein